MAYTSREQSVHQCEKLGQELKLELETETMEEQSLVTHAHVGYSPNIA